MKNKFIYIITSFFALAMLFICFYFLNNGIETKTDGEITVRFIDENSEVIFSDELGFIQGDTLIELLEENFDNIDFSDGYLKSIGELKEYSTSTSLWYISILVNGEYSEVGINLIELEDGMVISFEMAEYRWQS